MHAAMTLGCFLMQHPLSKGPWMQIVEVALAVGMVVLAMAVMAIVMGVMTVAMLLAGGNFIKS